MAFGRSVMRQRPAIVICGGQFSMLHKRQTVEADSSAFLPYVDVRLSN